jgi:histidinol-phosphatase (PHP family)
MIFNEDHHLHTHYSKDADPEATFEAYIAHAKKLGLKAITFTDHHDIDSVHPLFHEPIDFHHYFKHANQIKHQTDLQVRIGVEVGYQSHVKKELDAFLKTFPFEYVILSIHYLQKKDLYTGEYYIGKSAYEAYEYYFQMCLEAIETMDNFDTFGHLDYIGRYAPYPDYDMLEHSQTIDKILKALILKNKNLEINTSGYVSQHRSYPSLPLLKRYQQLGGRKLIIGSDAHRVDALTQFYWRLKQDYAQFFNR